MPRAGEEALERGRGWGRAPKVGWPGQGPWAMGEEGTGTARQSLRSCPLGSHWGLGDRQAGHGVLEEEQGLKGQRHWWETDRRTDSRTTQRTWGPQNEVPRTDSL